MALHPKPDLILSGVRLFPGTIPATGEPQAVAILGSRIQAIGSERDISNMAGPDTRRIPCDNKWLLPAFTDAHTHLCTYAARKLQIDLTTCQSLSEALNLIRKKVEKTPENTWIIGGGWDRNRWGMARFPDKEMLDEISRRHFIVMQSKDWHSLWVNSNVLKICQISAASQDPAGGKILRMADGEPSGILQEKACDQIWVSLRPLPLGELEPALQSTFSECHQLGITGIHSVETPYDFSHYQCLYGEQKLGLRVFWYFPAAFLKDSEGPFQRRSGNSFLKICGVKLFADGSLGSQTAHMLSPYQGSEDLGVATLAPEEIAAIIRHSTDLNLNCAVHAIGDAANRIVLDGYQAVAAESRRAGLRHRIEHVQLLHPDDLSRLAELDVIASVQPSHLAADTDMIERHWGARGRLAYAFASLQQSGARLIFGSDTPIETFDPWKALYSAVARKPLFDPTRPGFCPEQAVTLQDAILAYTSGPAYAAFEENNLGSIAPGKLADLILIDRDIFAQPAEALLETRVQLTLQNGNIVHEDM